MQGQSKLCFLLCVGIVSLPLLCFAAAWAPPAHAASAHAAAPAQKKQSKETAASRKNTSPRSADTAAERPATPQRGNAAPPRQAKKAQKDTSQYTKEHQPARASNTTPWFCEGGTPKPYDPMWSKGISAETLTREKAAPHTPTAAQRARAAERLCETPQRLVRRRPGEKAPATPPATSEAMDTQKSIDNSLRNLSDYERTAETNASAKRSSPMHAGMRTEERNWRNPATEPVKVDQQMPITQRKVVGAYADVVDNDGVRVTMGPELTLNGLIQDENNAMGESKPNSLGLGMNFELEF